MSQKAVSFIHDILTEVLTDWNEPPHFHFNEALFRPFERIMQLELCDEDVQDQVSVSPQSALPSSPWPAPTGAPAGMVPRPSRVSPSR